MYEKSNFNIVHKNIKEILEKPHFGRSQEDISFSLSPTQLSGKGSGSATASVQIERPALFPSPL